MHGSLFAHGLDFCDLYEDGNFSSLSPIHSNPMHGILDSLVLSTYLVKLGEVGVSWRRRSGITS